MYGPLHRHRPAHKWTNGDLAAKVGADLGLPPDDEQRWILDTIFAEKAPERPASFEVGVISPRQNIKTSTLGIAALADLFVFGVERHLWTAHHGDTLKGTFNDFRSWIKSNPEYDEQVTFYEGHQDMSIVHKDTGNTIDFQSRTGKAGRGLTGVKRITLDEALYLEPKHVGAVYPTMLTRPGAQVRIGSSAGLLMSEQLRRIRDRGRAGKDKRLAYIEYGAEFKACLQVGCSHELVDGVGPNGCALDDHDLWWQANCALWPGRITEESLQDQRDSMPPDEFMREFLSWWEDPETMGQALPQWGDRHNAELATTGRPDAIGLAASVDHAWGSIAATAGDSPVTVGAVDRRRGTAWLVDEAVRIQQTHGCEVVIDKRGPLADLIPALIDANVRLTELDTGDYCDACAQMARAIEEGTVQHPGHPELDAAVRGASWRPVGDRRAFARKTSEISMLEAATLALWASLNPSPQVSVFFMGDLDTCDTCGEPAGDDAADRDYLCDTCWNEREGG